jgi:sugar phosphate isomerase/epimerase
MVSVPPPPLSIAACTTFHAPFEEDVEAYASAGVQGIGLWEYKMPTGQDARLIRALRRSGLRATFCFPAVKAVLPSDAFDLKYGQPTDHERRVRALCDSIARFAEYEPLAVCCLPGTRGDLAEPDARARVLDGLSRAHDAAMAAGVTLAVEVMRPQGAAMATTIGETTALAGAAGAGDLGILLDSWHFWDGELFMAEATAQMAAVVGIQVSERRPGSSVGMDRLLPGGGASEVPGHLRDLRAAGYDGWYEVEIFSDDGTFGQELEDSLWRWPATDLAAASRSTFDAAWGASLRPG